MKSLSLMSLLSISLTLGVPSVVLSHPGHEDEFQSTEGIERVEVSPETDSQTTVVQETKAEATQEESGGLPMMTFAAISAGVIILVGGAFAVMGNGSKKENS